MRKSLVVVLFVIISVASHAQSFEDVIFLRDGSVVYGQILEKYPNRSLEIITADKNVFVFDMNEISSFQIRKRKIAKQSNFFHSYPASGYRGRVEVGYEVGVGSLAMDRLKLNIINGYQINEYFTLGVGTGVRYYLDAEEILVPIYGDFKANYMIGDKITRFVSLGVGYTFNGSDDFSDVGLFLSPTIGLSYQLSNRNAINISLGYEVQKLDVTDEILKSINAGAVSINVGISF